MFLYAALIFLVCQKNKMTNLLIVNSTQSHEKPSAELGYTQLDVKRTHERLLNMNLEKLDYWIGCQLDDKVKSIIFALILTLTLI